MFNFFKRVYKNLTVIFCLILLIPGAIVMGNIFYNEFIFYGRAIVGGLFGLIIVLSLEVIFLTLIFFLIETNNKIVSKTTNNNVAHDFNEENFTDVWICKKCGKDNIDYQNLCEFCGNNKFDRKNNL